MANTAQARKRARQAEARRQHNVALRSALRTAIKKVRRAIDAGEVAMDSPVEMTANAAKEPPSKMGYAPGSLLTVQNAIRILMVKSANDVATAIAENVGGSVAGFAERMNAEALRLGMTNTHFVNAHGLHSDAQHTTARDMALLALAIRRDYPQYDAYFSLEALRAGETLMPNHNDLIGRFAGADGMKTGYTCPSGFNLVATATRDGQRLIAVVLGEASVEERADKAANLLAAAFGRDEANLPAVNALLQPSQTMSQPTNMREAICTEEAYKARMAARGESGEPAYRSPHIQVVEFTPQETRVGLGGTVGPVLRRFTANVPVPTPRPDYRPDGSGATAAVTDTGDDG